MKQATNGAAANRNKFTHLFDCHSNSNRTTNRQILAIKLIAFTPCVNCKQGF